MAINCLSCELKRANHSAARLFLLQWSPENIAKQLSEMYGECYYIETVGDSVKLMRKSKLPPYEPHFIRELR